MSRERTAQTALQESDESDVGRSVGRSVKSLTRSGKLHHKRQAWDGRQGNCMCGLDPGSGNLGLSEKLR